MNDRIVSLADAKARLSELTELAAAGEEIVITKRGKPVVRMSRPETPRRPVDRETLRKLTAGMQAQPESAGEYLRRIRDEARY